jgi:hypothetical protein
MPHMQFVQGRLPQTPEVDPSDSLRDIDVSEVQKNDNSGERLCKPTCNQGDVRRNSLLSPSLGRSLQTETR